MLQAHRNGGAGAQRDVKEDQLAGSLGIVRVGLAASSSTVMALIASARYVATDVLARRIDHVQALQTHARARAIVDAELVDEVASAVGPGHGRGRADSIDLRKRVRRRRRDLRTAPSRRRRPPQPRRSRWSARRADALRAAVAQIRLAGTRGHEVPLKRFMLEIVVAPTALHQTPRATNPHPIGTSVPADALPRHPIDQRTLAPSANMPLFDASAPSEGAPQRRLRPCRIHACEVRQPFAEAW